jgi:RimJ/RimL family protein N-acetyltransferase
METQVRSTNVEIQEAGLLLRPWQPADAGAVFRACQDPEIARWTMVAQPYRIEHAIDYVTTFTAQTWANGTAAPFGVFDLATGEMLASCGLVQLDRDAGEGEIGYWVAPWARGRGVATNAARAVARWSLRTLGLRRLVWRAKLGNHASRLVAARIGVRFEGVARAALRGRDGWHDGWVGGLLPGDLREAGAADEPDLVRTAARCAVFGRPQPTLTADTRHGTAVRLRPLRADDIPAIVLACQDPLSIRYTTVPHPYTKEHAEAFVHVFAPGGWQRGVEAVFAVADADDAYAGSMTLRLQGDENTTVTADVGYLIGPWARGRGYAQAALGALCEWGFAGLRLHRIEWEAFLGNDASRSVAERAGFVVEGMRRESLSQRGAYQSAWIGARLATDAIDVGDSPTEPRN